MDVRRFCLLKPMTSDKEIFINQITIDGCSDDIFSSNINFFEKISMWTFIALCHDLGYPLEKSQQILDKTQKMMKEFIPNPNIWNNFGFSGVQDNINEYIIKFMSTKMVHQKNKAEIEENNGTDDYKKNLYLGRVQPKYYLKYTKSLEHFDHGIISSVIIYKMLLYFLESDFNLNDDYEYKYEDARQFYIRREILRAMASHTCTDIYNIYLTTFSSVLFLCDELQEWGRKSWKSMYQGVGNSNVELDISSFNMKKIEYTEKIDMRNALKDQVIANIKRIIEKQYMLYSTTFRDGQYTAQREFDFIKHIRIKVSEVYKSIDTIDIEFSINCNTNNKFELSIKDSGDIEPEENKKTQYLISDIEDLMKPYMANRKYGECRFINECDIKNKGEER